MRGPGRRSLSPILLGVVVVAALDVLLFAGFSAVVPAPT